jgi:hypothetical protein
MLTEQFIEELQFLPSLELEGNSPLSVVFHKVVNYAINFIINSENKLKINCTSPGIQNSSKLRKSKARK